MNKNLFSKVFKPGTPQVKINLPQYDDMLSNENSVLRERVADLERKVQEQEDEIICLRSSMADVLRRLGLMENVKPASNSPSYNTMTLPSKVISKSMSNLRRNVSTSGLHSPMSISSTESSRRRTISPAPKKLTSTAYQNGSQSPANQQLLGPPANANISGAKQRSPVPNSLSATPLRNGPAPMLAPKPMSSSQSALNIKKWSSGADFHADTAETQPVSPSLRPSSSPNNRYFGSSVSLSSSIRSLANVGVQREPSFNADDRTLRLYLRGRPISLFAPSSVTADYDPHQSLSAPKEKLKLEWVYGYRGKDCRSNVHLLPTGEIVYFTAAVVVLFNPEEQMQRHYLGHTDDVKCLAVHPNRLIIASGQVAKHGGGKNRKLISPSEMESVLEDGENMPHVRIWDSIGLQTQQIVGIGEFERAVSCLAFSKTDGGALLAVVDESYDHVLSIWDWQRRHRITETKSANEQVFACEFHPTEKQLLITCGKSQISFWTFDGITLQRKMGIFEGRDKPKYVLCVAFSENGEVLSGDSNGAISVWNAGSGRVIRSAKSVHEGGVFSICALKGGRIITGGGRDRRLIEWDLQLSRTGKMAELPETAGPVRTIVPGKGSMLLIGTTHNCILQGTFQLNFNFLVQGHTDELWGLCAHPQQHQFLTAGYDKILRLWDSISRTVVWTKDIADPIHCCCFHPVGPVLVIGTTVGRWLVIDSMSRDVIIGQVDGNDIISAVKFSPDGKLLAVGSHDNSVYVYIVSEDGRKYNRAGRCLLPIRQPRLGHSSFLTNLDWSDDSQLLRTSAGDHEVLYWQAALCKPVVSVSSVRDVQWATDNCTLSWATMGVWPEGTDGTDINSVDRTSDNRLLATADNFGFVKLFKYPSSQPKAGFNAYAGHSSHVTGVRFLQGNHRLISIGGKDSSVFQWTVMDN